MKDCHINIFHSEESGGHSADIPDKHPTKPGLVTIPGNRNDELAPATLNSILKQAGLKP